MIKIKEVDKKILINLESKPYQLIECLLEEKISLKNLLEVSGLVIKIREYLGNKIIKKIEEKKVDSINDFYDYVNNLSDNYISKGFINADIILDSKYVNVLTQTNIETYVKVRFIEDEIGFLLKEEGYNSSLDIKTAKYIEVFNKIIPFYLSTDKTYKNIDSKARESFKFFIENQFKIVEEMILWFWENWLFSEFYNDAMNYKLEKENRLYMIFDNENGFNEYIKIDPSFTNHKNVYENLKLSSDKYFRLDNQIKNAQILGDKVLVVDQILNIDYIEIDNENISFYFESFLDEEHGFKIILKNHKEFDIL